MTTIDKRCDKKADFLEGRLDIKDIIKIEQGKLHCNKCGGIDYNCRYYKKYLKRLKKEK